MALMAKVTYAPLERGRRDKPIGPQPELAVLLDDKRVGTIFRRPGAVVYFYKPLTGDAESMDYPTLDAMKASLEGRE
jgi:hypothetical protein